MRTGGAKRERPSSLYSAGGWGLGDTTLELKPVCFRACETSSSGWNTCNARCNWGGVQLGLAPIEHTVVNLAVGHPALLPS